MAIDKRISYRGGVSYRGGTSRSSRSYGPPGSKRRQSAPTHQPSRGPTKKKYTPPSHQTGGPGGLHTGYTPPKKKTTITTGGPPSVLNPPTKKKTTVTTGGGSNIKTGPYFGSTIKGYKKTSNPLKNWKRHAILSNMLKKQMIPGGEIPNYHQISAYDFDKRFGLPDPVSKGLSTGYQYLTEGYRALTNPNYTLSDAKSRAKEESRLNKLGIEGLDPENMLNYQRALDYSNIKSSDDMRTFKAKYLADGGLIRLFKYGGYLG